jgi:D-alanyl-D-alanine carboxypeptidase
MSPSASLRARAAMALLLAASCAGCATSGRYASHWNGRRGYDGNGDYGYDRTEASNYRARAARYYPAPGPPDDPWGPYIHEAAIRFQVPDTWIREVMRQESGGRANASDGTPITSGAGAMGLMQVMPSTYDTLRQHYALGADPYDPHNNILAGAAYIREMYELFGSPGFLAAYNAGPQRLQAYLDAGQPVPDETVNYLASVAPRLGGAVATSGPLAVYAGNQGGGGRTYATAYADPNAAYAGGGMTGVQYASAGNPDAAYAGGGMTGEDYDATNTTGTPVDPADRAYDGGGLVTASAPTGIPPSSPVPVPVPAPLSSPMPLSSPAPSIAAPTPYGAQPYPAYPVQAAVAPLPPARQVALLPAGGFPTPVSAQPALVPVAAPVPRQHGDWGIQVGAYPDPSRSLAVLALAKARAKEYLVGAQVSITPVARAETLYRARLVGLTAQNAVSACTKLSTEGMGCFRVAPGS